MLQGLGALRVALGSGWANTSAMRADPEYGAYVIVLREEDAAPFPPRSDEEEVEKEDEDDVEKDQNEDKDEENGEKEEEEDKNVEIDLDGIGRRTRARWADIDPQGGALHLATGRVSSGFRLRSVMMFR